MTLDEFLGQNKAIADRAISAIQNGNIDGVEKALEDSHRIDQEWISQSGFKAGARVSFGGLPGTIMEDPSIVLHRGAIRCLVQFDYKSKWEWVGMIP